MTSKTPQARGARLLLVLALTMGATQARALEVWLRADRTDIPVPGDPDPTHRIPMWGYAECTAGFASCGAVTAPGPDLTVPAGDGSLTVHLQNGLDEPTSLVIPGQTAVMTPVWFEPAGAGTYSGARPAGNTTARVRSFTHEAPPGGAAQYDWPALRPGTYLYESGTHPQIQVQMGLHGALVHDAVAAAPPAKAEAYPGVTYDRSAKVLYSEVDRALHDAVASGAYGTTGPTSTFDYHPSFFLVNGAPYAPGAPPIATAAGGERVLLRFVNAGLRTHVPMVLGEHMQMIAEDGSPYPWADHPRLQVTAELPAAKTIDAILTPTNVGPGEARLPIIDRRLDVTNAGVPDAGLIAFLAVTPGNAAPIITSWPNTNALVGQAWAYQVEATDPNPGDTLAYALAVAPPTMTVTPGGGLVQWTPDAAGSYPVTITVTDAGGLSAAQSFSITVLAGNVPPVITSSAPTTGTQGQLYSYQAVASDPNVGDTQAWSLDAGPAGMSISAGGLVQWTPTNAQAIANGGQSSATIRVTDSGGLFATQTFTVTVANVNDAPVAANDGPYAWVEGGTLTRAAPGVLANDTDPDGDPLTAVSFSASVGTLTGNPNGSFSWLLPMGSAGTRTFTYRARDPGLATSAPATVTVNVQANRPPTAVDDTLGAPRRTNANAGSFPVVLQVLANDYDPDTAIDSTNVINPATVAIAVAPNKGGTVTVNANGTVSYTPKLNFKGTETFTYRVRDNRGSPGALSNQATVRVNVQ